MDDGDGDGDGDIHSLHVHLRHHIHPHLHHHVRDGNVPEAQTLFTEVHGTVLGKPAVFATCVAGACPKLAPTTLPKYTSWISDGLIPVVRSGAGGGGEGEW